MLLRHRNNFTFGIYSCTRKGTSKNGKDSFLYPSQRACLPASVNTGSTMRSRGHAHYWPQAGNIMHSSPPEPLKVPSYLQLSVFQGKQFISHTAQQETWTRLGEGANTWFLRNTLTTCIMLVKYFADFMKTLPTPHKTKCQHIWKPDVILGRNKVRLTSEIISLSLKLFHFHVYLETKRC